ncbi:MAG TPA: HAMP domain-containing protein [Terriglobia bacterium]|nr:HAMP domain-containing protein [Terriglobia bacterium]
MAYSLAIVRLILVPVIFLAIYYLFRMGMIVDRIVSVDAPVATMAERVSIEMMDARRAEQDYFLSHDPDKLRANQQDLNDLEQLIGTIRDLQPAEQPATQKMLQNVKLHRARLDEAVSRLGEPGQAPVERIQKVVRAYEKDLDSLLRHDRREGRGRLVDDLRSQVDSFDAQIAETIQTEDPALRQATAGLQTSSDDVRQTASDLEKRSWNRVLRDHQDARGLLHRAEWVLSIVSGLTIILSVLVSFILPRQVVKPLVDLKEAVDHAATGNYEIEFDVQGEGEIVQLANSLRRLLAHVREMTLGVGAGSRH